MNAIQILLIGAAVLWLASYLSHMRTQGLARVVAVAAAMSGILLVVFPGLSVRLAHFFGVSRGVDLVIYLSLVGFGFLWLQLTARMRDLEGRITELVRQLALEREIDEPVRRPALQDERTAAASSHPDDDARSV